MKTVSLEFAEELIDFAPTAKTKEMGFGESQLHGAVAAYNMLARNSVAYLADEVGMGKTYVALGVLGLLRHLSPAVRVMIVAPRENIQRKWVKELTNFVRSNWKVEDNSVKGLDGRPARHAAQARLAALNRGTGTLSLTLKLGMPTVSAESPLTLVGFRAGVNGRWIVTRVTHEIDNRGYSNSVDAETPTGG